MSKIETLMADSHPGQYTARINVSNNYYDHEQYVER